MSDSFVTQCPHCRTSFRVSPAQLGAANGAVRCGACLYVFNAHQQMLEKPVPQPAGSTPMVAPAAEQPAHPQAFAERLKEPQKDSLDTAWIHDDLDLDSLDLDEELARLEQEEQQHLHGLRLVEPSLTAQPRISTTPPLSTDERWAEQLLEESQQPANRATPAPATESPQLDEPQADSATDEAWQKLAADPAERQEPSWRDDEDEDQDQDQDREQTPADAAVEEIESSASAAEPSPLPGFRPNENLLELSDDPLQLQWQAPGKPWGRWLGWGALNLLAAGALLAQYSAYHFDELARQDNYRPWFESICPQLGCTLPPKVDVNLIKSSNLVVRSHPDFAGALVVDAILYNRASFAQPFPLLELRFSDINNKLLANRRFKPGEYLAGELAGQSDMPPQTPIHISLDILDPGQEAVNYNLTFQSPE